MIYNAFIHLDETDRHEIFRSNVSQFVNDTETHPILKYKAFIAAFVLIISGLIILLLFNYDKILDHSFWKHLFVPISELRDKYMNTTSGDEDIFGYDYKYNETDASIFRKAIEGMTTTNTNTNASTTTTKDGKVTTKNGEFVSADTESAEKKKNTPCATDCSDYVALKGKINDLSKYVNAVKDQTDEIKQTSQKIQELGKQIEDLNKSLSPGGQVKITM
jgi:hypothetical protein